MPFYQPWLTVACAVSIAIAVIAANGNCCYLVPIILAIIVIVLAAILKLSKQIVFLVLILLLFFFYARVRLAKPAADDLSAYTNRTVFLIAGVLDDSGTNQTGGYYLKIRAIELIFPERRKISSCAKLFARIPVGVSHINYKPGQVLQIKGRIHPLSQFGQPWLSGLEAMYARQKIFCQIEAYSSDIKVLGKYVDEKSWLDLVTNKLSLFISDIRQQITAAHIRFLGIKAGSLLASMVLGDQAVLLNQELLEAFRKIGLSHIVAASGFNLTVVTMMTYWILRALSLQKRVVTFIVSTNVIIYSALAGLSASIVRAGITCLLVLIAKYFYRRLHGAAALSLGLIINVIIDPGVLMDPGGQLSYAATAGIIFGAESVANILSIGLKNKVVKVVSAMLSVVLMAQLAVLPIQLFHFCQMGLLFLPANLLIDPLVTPITIAGFLASMFGVCNLPGLPVGLTICQWLDWLAVIPLQIIVGVTERLGAFDMAVLNTGRPILAAIVLYYLAFAGWLMSIQKQRHRLLATAVFVCSLLALFYQPQLKKPTIIILPNSVICINEHRLALCLGVTNRQTNKILAYYATSKNNGKRLIIESEKGQQILAQTINSRSLMLSDNINPGRYLVILGKARNDDRQLKVWLKQNQLLSLRQLNTQLPTIDFKLCCPDRAVRFYSIEAGGTSFN